MMALAVALAAAVPARSAQAPALLILPFGFFDTSGEQRDQRAEHAARLAAMARQIGDGLQAKGFYRIVPPTPAILACDSKDQDCLLAAARKAGGDRILVGAVQKASTLISQVWVGVFDARDGRRVLYRQLSFRGDSDDAWQHAGAFLLHEIEADAPQQP